MLEKYASELKSGGTAFAIITVIKVDGSAPRHVGSKMIVAADGRTFGTIGGGTLEHQATSDALEFIRKNETSCKKYLLGPELGQCCGGNVELFFETVVPKKRVAVFGAGHIAEALCPMLEELNFDVTLIDERKERIELPAFKHIEHRLQELPSDVLKMIKTGDDLYVIVITHQHKDDEEIVKYFLDKPCRYLGMIGSKHKWEKFKARYSAAGFSNEQIARVVTPIGLDIGSETPFEIAVSIVAQLIKFNATNKLN